MAFKKKATKYKKGSKKIKRRFSKRKRAYKKKVYKRKRRYSRKRSTVLNVDYRQEFGGTVKASASSTGQIVYAGHSNSGNDIINNLFVLLVKKLMAAHGNFYSSDEDRLVDNTPTLTSPFYTISLIWRLNPSDTTAQILDYQVGGSDASQSVHDVGYGIATSWVISVRSLWDPTGSGAPLSPLLPQFHQMILYHSTVAGGQKDNIVAKIPLDKTVIGLKFFSLMKVQNKTNSEAATGSSFTDLNNVNPLAATLYKGKWMRNYFRVNGTDSGNFAGSYPVGLAPYHDGTNGGIIANRDDFTARNNFREMPTHKDMEFKKSIKFVLHPGQIVQDKLYYKLKISLDKLMHKLLPACSTNTTECLDLGVAHLFAFDKLVYDRSQVVATNPPTIGYEIDSYIKFSISQKKSSNKPYIMVQNTALNFAA